ncbi:MAG TPA: hypothetical protein VN446_03630 [Candidatus Acidoferrum sp.]|nr:hypothetical protein [Candidatus Acidoferrum sp.]
MRMGSMLLGAAAIAAVGAVGMSSGRTGRRMRRRVFKACRSAGTVMRSVGEMFE